MKQVKYLLFVFLGFSLWSCSSSTSTEVKIGNQTWSAVNLSTDKFANGDLIPEAKTEQEWLAAAEKGEPAWCHYNNDPSNDEKYGKLYNWHAVNDPRGLAPKGWNVPSDADWSALSEVAGGDQTAGEKLKSTLGWDGDGNGSDEFGFNAVPGGFRKTTGEFSSLGSFALYWSSTAYDDQIATYRYLDAQTNELSRFNYLKGDGLSIRLIKE
jgi:uncharacterized protein (TIGR02145 family)